MLQLAWGGGGGGEGGGGAGGGGGGGLSFLRPFYRYFYFTGKAMHRFYHTLS